MKLYYKNLQDKLAINLSMQYDGHLKMGGSVGRQADGLTDRQMYRSVQELETCLEYCPELPWNHSKKCIKRLKLDFIIFEQGV